MKLRTIAESDYTGLDTEDFFGDEVLGVGKVWLRQSVLDLEDAVAEVSETLGEPEFEKRNHWMTYSWGNVQLTQRLLDEIDRITHSNSPRGNVKWEFSGQ